jgi:hypothetical protein
MRDGTRRSLEGGAVVRTAATDPDCANAAPAPPNPKPAPTLAVRNSLLFMRFFIRLLVN